MILNQINKNMYTANSPRELKRLMKEDKFPILVTDEKTKGIVEILESLKSKGVLPTAKEEIKKTVASTLVSIIKPTTNAISEPIILAIVTVSLTTIVALYALYKNKNITWKVNPDGSIELSTN